MDKPVWNVYIESNHGDCNIEKYNIFDHGGFWDMCNIIWENVHDRHPKSTEVRIEDFKVSIVKELHYYFWGKVEWETCLTSVFEKDRKYKKIDVYSQIALNMTPFLDYLWNWFTLNKK